MQKFRWLFALVLLVAALPAVSYAQDDAFTCPQTGGTLVVASNADPRTLNGLYANDGDSLSVVTFLVEPLVLGGENWGDSCRLPPTALAQLDVRLGPVEDLRGRSLGMAEQEDACGIHVRHPSSPSPLGGRGLG